MLRYNAHQYKKRRHSNQKSLQLEKVKLIVEIPTDAHLQIDQMAATCAVVR